MSEQNLKAAILKTLAWFDIFNFPLTSLEIWKYLYSPSGGDARLGQIELALKKLPRVKSHQGFYFLLNQPQDIVQLRKKRYNIAEEKYRKVKFIGRLLAIIPFVRMIAVCNTLAYSNSREDGDIDLFIVTKTGRVWITRFFCLLFLKIFGLRPKGDKAKDKFCLSFFVDEERLNIEPVALPRNDIYLWYWLSQLYPVYDFGGYYDKFKEANAWVKQYLSNSIGVEPNLQRMIKLGPVARLIKKLKEAVLDFNWLEEWSGGFQFKHLPKNLKAKINKDPGVMVKDGLIKLITNDRREGYRNEWIIKANSM